MNDYRYLETQELDEINGGSLILGLAGFAFGGVLGAIAGTAGGIVVGVTSNSWEKGINTFSAVTLTTATVGAAIGAAIPLP